MNGSTARRCLALLLAMLLCLSLPAWASPEPAAEAASAEALTEAPAAEPSPALDGAKPPAAYPIPALTGNQAHDTAQIALSQLGYAAQNGTAYGAWWNNYIHTSGFTKTAWCAMFAAWCAANAGAGLGVAFDKQAPLAEKMFDWLKENAVYDTSFTTAPREGDFIFFGGRTRAVAHVAVVISYDPETRTVTYVGGNQTNPDIAGGGTSVNGGIVSMKTLPWAENTPWGPHGDVILGYGRPNYSGVPEPEPGPTLPDAPVLLREGRFEAAAALLRRAVGAPDAA